MLDDQTMRIALGAVAATVLVLFYLAVYRPTRSSFSGWWCISLLLAGLAILLLLDGDSPLRAVTYLASTALASAGSTCVWFAMRSLGGRRLPRLLLVLGPGMVVAASATDIPDESGLATTGPVSIYMAAMFIAGATEAWRAWRERQGAAQAEPNGEALVALFVVALAATALSAFYALRVVMQVTTGPDSSVFARTAGSGTEDVILLVCMVAVTFSVSAVGWDEQTRALRRRAARDDLTGLWGRTEFRAHAQRALDDAGSTGERVLLVVADLDHFKSINDQRGHAAGDEALVVFAEVLNRHLGPHEHAGRLGGEEFGMLLVGSDDADALARLRAISDDFAQLAASDARAVPTVSYGIAGPEDADAVAQVFEHADLAMYAAKAQGRDRAVRYRAPEMDAVEPH